MRAGSSRGEQQLRGLYGNNCLIAMFLRFVFDMGTVAFWVSVKAEDEVVQSAVDAGSFTVTRTMTVDDLTLEQAMCAKFWLS